MSAYTVIQGFTVTYNAVIGVTTVSFSKNRKLTDRLKSEGFTDVLLNESGRRMKKDELISMLKKCDGVIVGLDRIDGELLCEVPELKAVAKYGVGLDNIDFDACGKYGVKVLHTPGVNRRSVAELALGAALGLCRNIYVTSNLHKNGRWEKMGGTQLSGKTVGIIGAGNIGKDFISLLKPFGCRILVNDIIDISEYCHVNGLEEVTKEAIFSEADIISVHTPLTELTGNMINRETFEIMKDSALVINTARGGIINENDLKEALKTGSIAGAAVDAYVAEPPEDKELIALPNLICTPHIGGNSAEAVEAMGIAAIENIKEYFGMQK